MASPNGSRSRRLSRGLWIILGVVLIAFVSVIALRRSQLIRVAPVRVEIYEDGRIMVVTKPIKPADKYDISITLPMEIPVFSIAADGTQTPGVVYRNTTDNPVDSIEFKSPVYVIYEGRGIYRVEMRLQGVELSHGTFLPGHIGEVAGSNHIRVLYGRGETNIDGL